MKQTSCRFYCSCQTCPFFYQNPFNDENDWKRHLAYDHFICVDCALDLYSENDFLDHCDHIHHNAYSKESYLKHVQDYGELSKRLKTFELLRQEADSQNCCPFEDCKFHYEPLIFPVDLKTHLAAEHYICWECYYSKEVSAYSFSKIRELIAHWIDMSDEEDQHGLDFCWDCFDNELISDSKIFVTSSLSGLQLHQRCHNNLELSSQPRSSWQQPGNYLPAESGEAQRGRASSAPHLEQCYETLYKIKKNGKRSCPVKDCKFYKKNMTTPANLKGHLAAKHNMCGECYWDTNRQISFLTRRNLIEHCMRQNHKMHYCKTCFNDFSVKDELVFFAVIPAKLKKHQEAHDKKQKTFSKGTCIEFVNY